jgi:hypothetical protein
MQWIALELAVTATSNDTESGRNSKKTTATTNTTVATTTTTAE